MVKTPVVRGIPVDPALPALFDSTPHEQRSDEELATWWGKPYIATVSYDSRPRGMSKRAWRRMWPSGVRYDVRSLDGGTPHASTLHDSQPTLDAALDVALELRLATMSSYDMGWDTRHNGHPPTVRDISSALVRSLSDAWELADSPVRRRLERVKCLFARFIALVDPEAPPADYLYRFVCFLCGACRDYVAASYQQAIELAVADQWQSLPPSPAVATHALCIDCFHAP